MLPPACRRVRLLWGKPGNSLNIGEHVTDIVHASRDRNWLQGLLISIVSYETIRDSPSSSYIKRRKEVCGVVTIFSKAET